MILIHMHQEIKKKKNKIEEDDCGGDTVYQLSSLNLIDRRENPFENKIDMKILTDKIVENPFENQIDMKIVTDKIVEQIMERIKE